MNMLSADESKKLKSRTMRKVYGIWFMRKVAPIFALEVALFAFSLTLMQNYMSFGNVWNNVFDRAVHYSLMNFSNYVWIALSSTEFYTIGLLMAGAVLGAFLVRDTMKVSRRFSGNFHRRYRVI